MQVLHSLVDGINLPVGPPRHSKLPAQSLDHLNKRYSNSPNLHDLSTVSAERSIVLCVIVLQTNCITVVREKIIGTCKTEDKTSKTQHTVKKMGSTLCQNLKPVTVRRHAVANMHVHANLSNLVALELNHIPSALHDSWETTRSAVRYDNDHPLILGSRRRSKTTLTRLIKPAFYVVRHHFHVPLTVRLTPSSSATVTRGWWKCCSSTSIVIPAPSLSSSTTAVFEAGLSPPIFFIGPGCLDLKLKQDRDNVSAKAE